MVAARAWNSFKSKPIIQKWGAYWKSLYNDYKEVALDTYTDAQNSPKKTAVILTAFGFLGAAFKTNPTELQFRQAVVASGSRLALTTEPTRNPASNAHVRELYRFQNQGLLRYLSLGLFSIVWRDNFDPSTDLYLAQCPYLQPSYSEIVRERIVDIGFFGKWWHLEKAMVDYDVNDELWNYVDPKFGGKLPE